VCGNAPDWLKLTPEEELLPKKKRVRKGEALAGSGRAGVPKGPPQEVRPALAAATPRGDSDLVEFFKEWRRRTAQRTAVPAYVVLSDAALEDLCRKQPTNLRELLGVSGIGERKAELYGSEIFAAFEAFRNGARAAARQVSGLSPAEETIRLLAEGKSFEEIAQIRGRQVATVVNMVADLIEKGRLEYRIDWVGEENHQYIEEAVKRLGSQWLKPLHEALSGRATYDQIRLVVAYVRYKTGAA
jgi:ATP-dependent DNA helicase RecQ